MNYRMVGVILWAAFLGSCGSKGPVRPVSVALTAPAKVAKADLAPAQARAVEVANANAVAAGSVGRVAKELADMKLELRDATKAADRMRQQKSASEAELQENWQRFTVFQVAADRAGEEAQAAKVALDEQRVLGDALGTELMRARVEVDAKNAEADGLRLTLGDTERLRASAVDAADANAEAAEKARGEKERLSGEIRIYRWVAVGVGAVVLLVVGVKVLRPL